MTKDVEAVQRAVMFLFSGCKNSGSWSQLVRRRYMQSSCRLSKCRARFRSAMMRTDLQSWSGVSSPFPSRCVPVRPVVLE